MYPEHAAPGDVAVYQFTTSSAVAGYLAEHRLPLVLDFHNFTGPEFFAGWEPEGVVRATRAAEELAQLAPAGAPRPGQERLQRADAAAGGVPAHGRGAGAGRLRAGRRGARPAGGRRAGPARPEGGADILFVGRVVPSKAQHELVKALWAYRRLYDGRARLHLIGGSSSYEYSRALLGFVDDLGLSEAVRITGEVTDASLAAHYAAADVYLSLSAHEGFGVPLVEAMVAGVPVVTSGAGAVRDTVADAGLLLQAGDPSYVAAALHRVCTDERLRATLVASGRRRAAVLAGGAAAEEIVDAIAGAVGRP